MKRCTTFFFLIAMALSAQPGKEAPPISAPPLDVSQPFTGWDAFRGNIVIVDFWATWCGPCIAGLDKVAKFEKDFGGQPVRFLTVASDEMPRVKKYFAEKGLALPAFVEGTDGKTFAAFGVQTIPAAAIIDRQGHLIAVTPGDNVTAEVIRRLLNGEKVDLPPYERSNNITWDRDEILWQDGVQPEFQVVLKPMQVSGGGFIYKPGSNHISGDGAPVDALIQAAWQTDHFHLDCRAKLPGQIYRYAATVPKGRESELLPALQDAIQRNFGLRIHWDGQERDALVLSRIPGVNLQESEAAEPLFMFLRGKITMQKQTAAKLAETLPNWMNKPVVDETGLTGLYDFELEYRDDGPAMLRDGLKEKYGLVLTPAKRTIKMLVVEPK